MSIGIGLRLLVARANFLVIQKATLLRHNCIGLHAPYIT